MAVIDTLKKLEDLVADASHLPFSDKALVNDDEIVHLVEELRMDLPKELNRAAEIMQEQENIIGRAREEAKDIVDSAQTRANQLLEESEIVIQAKERARAIIQKSLSKQFAPEFLNRLDEIITFDQLDLAAIKLIIDIELRSLFKRVKELGYDITITDKAKEFVATKGYDVQFGARPLKRAIQNYIEDGICERILAGKIHEGDTIAIGKNPNADELTFK